MSKYFMPLLTIAAGVGFNLVSVLSRALQGADAHITVWIPAFIGGIFIILGAVAFNAKLRMHLIHAGLALALLVSGMMVYMTVKELLAEDGTALRLFAFETTGVIAISYIVIGVRSFLHARKLRKQAAKAVKAAEKVDAVPES
ncbi:MAG: hypothetical protein AAGH99_09570 [Planctomycetota bacterium]